MQLALLGPELEENLALRYIHAAAVATGYTAEIFDFHDAGQIPDLVRRIVAAEPAVVGLSMVFTARAREYVELARALRSAGCRAHITAGGHFACFNAEQLLTDCPAIDSVLHGEGERAIVDLLSHLAEPTAVAGITIRSADGIITTPPRPPVDDLDELPLPTRPATFHRYFDLPIANILSGRGCFADCDFCSINAWHRRIGGKRFRQRSVSSLAGEMATLYHERGVRLFNFHDDNFFLPTEEANVARFSEMRDALWKLGVGRIGIQVKARPDSVRAESMAILKEMGLFRVFLGIESNSVAGLRALGRGINRAQNRAALELLKGMRVHVTFNLLMFEPDCTIADLRDNIALIDEQREVPLNFCRTEVYAGTALERRLQSAGRLEGTYYGYGYTIADERAQLAYEMFRQVFTPRNFDFGGMNLRAMTVDYYLHILRHFYSRLASDAIYRQSKGFISDVNGSNARLLGQICDFAEGCDLADKAGIAAVTKSLCAQRAGFDAAIAGRATDVLERMRSAVATPETKTGSRRMSRASVAAAVMAASILGVETASPGDVTRPTPPSSTSRPTTQPPPMPPGLEPCEMVAPDLVALNDDGPFIDWAATEMAPRPPQPPPPPPPPPTGPTGPTTTTAPSTTRAPLPPLPDEQAAAVQGEIGREPIKGQLAALSLRHNVRHPVIIQFDIAADGSVSGFSLLMPPGDPPDLPKDLAKLIPKWKFAGVKQAGTCTMILRFGQEEDTHPTEMAPHPFEMAPRDLNQ